MEFDSRRVSFVTLLAVTRILPQGLRVAREEAGRTASSTEPNTSHGPRKHADAENRNPSIKAILSDFGLGCDYNNEQVAQKLFEARHESSSGGYLWSSDFVATDCSASCFEIGVISEQTYQNPFVN